MVYSCDVMYMGFLENRLKHVKPLAVSINQKGLGENTLKRQNILTTSV